MSSNADLERDPLNAVDDAPECATVPISQRHPCLSKSYLASVAVLFALAVTTTMAVVGFHSHPLSTEPIVVEELISRASEPRCVECYTDQCSLDYKTWSSCPQTHPYYSDIHKACVSARKDCNGGTPVSASFGKSLCADCFAKKCFVGHRVLRCSQRTPYYLPTLQLCANSCSAPPGPPPPPSDLYDCDSAYNNWEAAWSDNKKAWCCDNKFKGCHKGEACAVPTGHVCDTDTDETCNFTPCGDHRGKASCEWQGFWHGHKCICEQGACLHNLHPNKCVEVGCCFQIMHKQCTKTYITSKQDCLESGAELMTRHPNLQIGFSSTCPSSVAEGMKLLAA